MKLIRPFAVTTAALTSTNVYETVPTAYAGGTTYAAGDIATRSGTSNSHAVYRSLQAGNTGNTPESSPLWWEALGTVYGAYAGGTTYASGDTVTDTTNHLLYESAAGSNTGHALTDTAWWIELGPSNAWAIFDQKTGTQTQWLEELAVEVAITGRADSVVLMNMDNATSVNITVTGDAEEHNEDYNLNDSSMVNGWYSWFYEAIRRKTDLAVTNLPAPLNGDIAVTVTGTTDSTLSVGGLIFGLGREIGNTQYGATVGITDYSRFEADDFGNYTFTQRSYNKRAKFTVWMDSGDADFTFNLLASYRATPIVVIGSDDYTSTFQFGLLKDWGIALSYPSHSILDLEFQGI